MVIGFWCKQMQSNLAVEYIISYNIQVVKIIQHIYIYLCMYIYIYTLCNHMCIYLYIYKSLQLQIWHSGLHFATLLNQRVSQNGQLRCLRLRPRRGSSCTCSLLQECEAVLCCIWWTTNRSGWRVGPLGTLARQWPQFESKELPPTQLHWATTDVTQ